MDPDNTQGNTQTPPLGGDQPAEPVTPADQPTPQPEPVTPDPAPADQTTPQPEPVTPEVNPVTPETPATEEQIDQKPPEETPAA